MCLSFLNSYVCRIVFSGICRRAYREQLSRRGTTLRSHHWSGLLSKDWQIIPLDYPRRRRPHNPCTAHRPVIHIYIYARAHMRVQSASRRWLYGYAAAYTHIQTHTYITVKTHTNLHALACDAETHSRAIANGRGATTCRRCIRTRVKLTASHSVTHLNTRGYIYGRRCEITR